MLTAEQMAPFLDPPEYRSDRWVLDGPFGMGFLGWFCGDVLWMSLHFFSKNLICFGWFLHVFGVTELIMVTFRMV